MKHGDDKGQASGIYNIDSEQTLGIGWEVNLQIWSARKIGSETLIITVRSLFSLVTNW